MLNTFPSLLTYTFFAPTLLRITVALAIAYIAYVQFIRREEIAEMRVPVVGKIGGLIWIALIVETAIAIGLFVGYLTQICALLAMLLCIKHFIYAKKYPRVMPLCRADYIFIFVICLSLLLTGAGAFAFDLPL
jgi:uncharacterized membrane protein YphA (DoxX/SURF4 family)